MTRLLEIAQYTRDIRYKPGKINLTADQLSRPVGTPLGDAYLPDVDLVADGDKDGPVPASSVNAVKETMTNITPLKLKQAQAQSTEINNLLQGKHSPRARFKWIQYKGENLLCEVSSSVRPYVPESMRQEVMQNLHSLDHAG